MAPKNAESPKLKILQKKTIENSLLEESFCAQIFVKNQKISAEGGIDLKMHITSANW